MPQSVCRILSLPIRTWKVGVCPTPLSHSCSCLTTENITTVKSCTFRNILIASCWKLHSKAYCEVNVKKYMDNEVHGFEWLLECASTKRSQWFLGIPQPGRYNREHLHVSLWSYRRRILRLKEGLQAGNFWLSCCWVKWGVSWTTTSHFIFLTLNDGVNYLWMCYVCPSNMYKVHLVFSVR